MTEIRELPREPWWEVVAVFDPEEKGRDFAYTVGLAERGLPEVHMWARPDQGEDPGLDWRFSSRDAMYLLNELAWRLVDERVAPGDTWTRRYDDGLVEVHFELGSPVAAETVEAYQAEPSPVCPLRWSLHRVPEGPLEPMPETAQREAEAEYARLLAEIGPQRPAEEPWALPETPSWSPEQRWGPRTPLVAAHAALFRSLTVDQMSELANISFPMGLARVSTYPQVVARAAGRPAGRTVALERLGADAAQLVAELGVTWGVLTWQAALAWVSQGEAFPQQVLRRLVGDIVTSHLTSVAVADLLEEGQLLTGIGPLAFARATPGLPPDERWHAAPQIVAAVVDLVVRADKKALAAAARSWQLATDDASVEAAGNLLVGAIQGPSMFPDLADVLPEKTLQQLRIAGVLQQINDRVLQSWLGVISTVLTHRAALEPETVATVLRHGAAIEGLAEAVNSPVAVP